MRNHACAGSAPQLSKDHLVAAAVNNAPKLQPSVESEQENEAAVPNTSGRSKGNRSNDAQDNARAAAAASRSLQGAKSADAPGPGRPDALSARHAAGQTARPARNGATLSVQRADATARLDVVV